MKTEIVNYTPHEIAVITKWSKTRIPSAGIARVSQKNTIVDEIEGFDIFQAEYGAVEGLPEPQNNTLYIVSAIVKSALPSRDDLLVPTEFIRDEAGKILGCRGFLR